MEKRSCKCYSIGRKCQNCHCILLHNAGVATETTPTTNSQLGPGGTIFAIVILPTLRNIFFIFLLLFFYDLKKWKNGAVNATQNVKTTITPRYLTLVLLQKQPEPPILNLYM